MRDNHDLWRKRIHIPPYLSGDLWRDRAQVMAILSDCMSCKVVDQVRTISHTPRPGWDDKDERQGLLSLDFLGLLKALQGKLLYAEMGMPWPSKSDPVQSTTGFMTCLMDKLEASYRTFVICRKGTLKHIWPFYLLVLLSALWSSLPTFSNV